MSPPCHKCGESLAGKGCIEVARGERYCPPCHAATFFTCLRCEPQFKRPKLRVPHLMRTSEGEEVCDYCYYTKFSKCVLCTKEHLQTDGVTSSSGRFYCPPCSVDRNFTCQMCERTQETDHMWKRIEGYGPVCRGCESAYKAEFEPPPIHEYSYKPKPKWQGKKPANGLYFGMELEVDHYKSAAPSRDSVPESVAIKNDKNATALRQAVPFIYCKRDGSVPGGFEVVSHPMSWDWIRENEAAFDPIFALVKKGYVSHDGGRCGMHVHMSKEAFTPLHLYKFMHFFQKNPEFILNLSQRGAKADMDRWASVEYGSDGDRHRNLTYLAKNKGGHGGRYKAINLSNAKTVEIRIFRGTLKKERFFKNLEFCMAMHHFTDQISIKGCTVQNFIGFVALHRSEYKNLHDFLKERYKWQLVYRTERKPGQAKAFIRYEGRITPEETSSANTDVSDEDWADILFDKQETQKRQIQSRITQAAAA